MPPLRAGLWLSCALLNLSLIGCTPEPPKDAPQDSPADSDSPPDADADGFDATSAGGEDCDDTDPAINPQATERCDGFDNDCDGEIDGSNAEDAVLRYPDIDADGYGADGSGVTACTHPDGYTEAGGDCDDDNAAVHPGAAEQPLNGLDDDCDPQTPDGDLDGDGFYAPEVGGDDCDDANAAVYPGAPEICGDGVVNGCPIDAVAALSGCLLGGASDLGGADMRFTGEGAGDQAALSVSSAGDVDGDGLDDLIVGARYNDAGARNAGRAYLLLGGGALSAGAGSFSLASADSVISGVAMDDYVGVAVASAGDVNGDGQGDVIIGSSGDNDAGAAYLLLGGGAMQGASIPIDSAELKLNAEARNDGAAGAVDGAGDVDGDGLDDVLVGAEGNDRAGSAAGAAYLLLGGGTLAGASGSLSLADADITFLGALASDRTGRSLQGVGDIDGDGRDDVMIYAPNANSGRGTAHLLLSSGALPSGAVLTPSNTDLTILGETSGDYAGYATARAGDMDADGRADLILGAPGWGGDASGAAMLLLSSGALAGASGQLSLADADLTLTGENPGDEAGVSVAGVGDVEGDGQDDLLVGAYKFGDQTGASYLLLGGGSLDGASGQATLRDADRRVTGLGPGDRSGWSVAGAGDLNGDGRPDLVIGAYEAKGSGSDAGDAYVMFGGGY